MHVNTADADDILQTAIEVAQKGDEFLQTLDELPAPIYVTDADGLITYYNRACIEFAGRTPVVGQDNWCVTWKLFTEDGLFLPHDECPMAVAIREKRAVRGMPAIAERPDGRRVHFEPYPTPLLDDDGSLVGAVNMLIDITDRKRVELLRAQALRCKRLAGSTTDRRTEHILNQMAAEYEAEAAKIQRTN